VLLTPSFGAGVILVSKYFINGYLTYAVCCTTIDLLLVVAANNNKRCER